LQEEANASLVVVHVALVEAQAAHVELLHTATSGRWVEAPVNDAMVDEVDNKEIDDFADFDNEEDTRVSPMSGGP
jgi:hypothetical protein